MKKSIITITLLIYALLSFGQIKSEKVDIQWGAKQKESANSTLYNIVGKDNTGIYVLKHTRGAFGAILSSTLEHFDNNFNKTKSVRIKNNKKKLKFEFILHLNNKLYIFSSLIDKKLKSNFLFVQDINKKTLLPNNDLVKVAENDYEKHSKNNTGKYYFRISRDSSKVLIYYDKPNKKNKSERFSIHIFDTDMNQLWEKQILLPYKNKLFDIKNYKISNTGDVYILSIKYKDKKKARIGDKPNYIYNILGYTNSGNDLIEYPVSIEGKFLTHMQIAINNENDIICGGFFSQKGTHYIKGSYFLKIDGKTTEITDKIFHNFSIDFITQNLNKSKKKKLEQRAKEDRNVEMSNYNLHDIILKDDGGVIS